MIYKIKYMVVSIFLILGGLSICNCNAYDLLGKLNSSGTSSTNIVKLKVFVTSNTTPGDMKFVQSNGSASFPSCSAGGLSGANCVCQQSAAGAGLSPNGEIFNAWLSISSTDAICNIIGLTGTKSSGCNNAFNSTSNTPYGDLNGNLLFNNLDGVQKDPSTNIQINENYGSYSGLVWTGTYSGATGTPTNCRAAGAAADWTDSLTGNSGTVGSTIATLSEWTTTTTGTQTCDIYLPIYCFQQP